MTLPSYSNLNIWVSSGSWTVPVDWNSSNNIIAVISGGGGGGYYGGGGGGYAHIQNFTATAGQIFYFNVGAPGNTLYPSQHYGTNGASSWINLGTNAQPGSNTNGIYATGGKGGYDVGLQRGGDGSGGVGYLGTVNYNGGDANQYGTQGGGGAAGYYGAGQISNPDLHNGGAGDAGYGGAGSGGSGTELWGGYGAGGGGDGGYSWPAGSPGFYGGGGGGSSYGGTDGRQGIVFICYNPAKGGFTPSFSFMGMT